MYVCTFRSGVGVESGGRVAGATVSQHLQPQRGLPGSVGGRGYRDGDVRYVEREVRGRSA